MTAPRRLFLAALAIGSALLGPLATPASAYGYYDGRGYYAPPPVYYRPPPPRYYAPPVPYYYRPPPRVYYAPPPPPYWHHHRHWGPPPGYGYGWR